MKVSSNYRCLFLILLVLAVYYPSLTGVVNSVDDIQIIKAYGINGHRTLQQILLPSNQFYFRPVIEVTYYLDNLLWGLDPSFMHLENVLLHAINVILVYLLTVEVSVLIGGGTTLPFLGALLFAIHPINTEAVSWIAGRTDPLAAFFILISLIFLFKAFQNGRSRYVFIALVSMLFSFIVKETSFMLLPVSVLLAYSVKLGDVGISSQIIRIRKWILFSSLMLFCCSVLYAVARFVFKPAGSDNAFSMLFRNGFDVSLFVRDFFLTPGFYLKKLIIPFPLNFAIDSISIWYIVPGVVAALSCLFLIRYRSIAGSLFVAAVLFIVPAVIVKFTGITWTPVAERYLYISSAFFSMWLSIVIINLISVTKWKIIANVMLIVLLCAVAVCTFRRNLVWQNNLSLFQDAVSKSPGFGDIHNELGLALSQKGDYREARKHFILARQYSLRPLMREFAELNLINCEMYGKSLADKRSILRKYIASHEHIQPDILRLLRNITQQLINSGVKPEVRVLELKELIVLNDRIYRETNDSLCIYNNGQIMLALSNKGAALEYFRKVVTIAPSDSYYYKPALKIVRQLESK